MKLYDLDIKPISYTGEISFSPNLYEVFQFNNKYYALGVNAADKSCGSVHELKTLNLDTDATTDYESEIMCPVCGNKDVDSWEFENDDNYWCGLCGADLAVSKNVSVTYSAMGLKLPTIIGEEKTNEN